MSKYFIVKNTIKQGPLSLDQLKGFKINKTDLIWKEGNEDWIKAEELPELAEIIQPEIPKTPFEKKAATTKKSFKANFLIPVVVGILLGFFAVIAWNSVKSTIYRDESNSKPTSIRTSEGIETPYEKKMDKYLAGEYGYRGEKSIADNEDFYYRNSEQGIFRPIKAIFSIFNSKAQFFVGKDESAPLVSFILFWIILCTIIYLIIYGIQIALHRVNN